MAYATLGMDSFLTTGETAISGGNKASKDYDVDPFWFHEAYLDYALTKNT